jgi:ABC-type ATPase with predicted acetyltransferase domain
MPRRTLSRRALRASALFGTLHTPAPDPLARAHEAALLLDARLRPGEIALIVGPSGGGKSCTGRALVRHLWSSGLPATLVAGDAIIRARAARRRVAVVDLFRSPLEDALGLLARAGLAEAALLARPWDELSEGQRARLAIALGMEEAQQPGPNPATLIFDEFASTLDRTTAAAIARTVRRWAVQRSVRIVCITAHDDVLEWLAPTVVLEQPLSGPATIARKGEAA